MNRSGQCARRLSRFEDHAVCAQSFVCNSNAIPLFVFISRTVDECQRIARLRAVYRKPEPTACDSRVKCSNAG